jgi:hypothetical protein
VVSYNLTPRDGATEFIRNFTYPLPNLALALLDALLVRRRIQAESEQATRQLKRRLEPSQA